MAINTVNNTTQQTPAYTAPTAKAQAEQKAAEKAAAEKRDSLEKAEEKNTGVTYEKTEVKNSVTKKYNADMVAKLKADAEQRTSQLRSLVEKMMKKQGAAIGNADSMWRFLAKGDFTVDAMTKAEAEADIAEDGYWGVNQTSDRILDFAKALSGNDPSKADELLEAFKKGFAQATGTWGDKLPDITQRTYDAVVEKFDAWKKGNEEATSVQTEA